ARQLRQVEGGAARAGGVAALSRPGGIALDDDDAMIGEGQFEVPVLHSAVGVRRIEVELQGLAGVDLDGDRRIGRRLGHGHVAGGSGRLNPGSRVVVDVREKPARVGGGHGGLPQPLSRQADGTRLDDLPQNPPTLAVSWNLNEICLKFDATVYMRRTKDINANLPETYTTECRCGAFLSQRSLARRSQTFR